MRMLSQRNLAREGRKDSILVVTELYTRSHSDRELERTFDPVGHDSFAEYVCPDLNN